MGKYTPLLKKIVIHLVGSEKEREKLQKENVERSYEAEKRREENDPRSTITPGMIGD